MKRRLVLAVTMVLCCSACGMDGASGVTAFYAIGHNPAGSDWGRTEVNLYLFFAASPSCEDLLQARAPQATVYLEPKAIDDLRFKASESRYIASAFVYDFDQMMLDPAVEQRAAPAEFEVTIDRSPEFRGNGQTPAASVISPDDTLVGAVKPMTIAEQPTSMHAMPFVARHCAKLEPRY